MKITAVLLLVGSALLALPRPAAAQPFNQVIVFGDSGVDSGFYKAFPDPGSSTAAYNTAWPAAVAHGAGAPTTSPGLMVSQFLAAFFGLSANPSNTSGGTNFATSGAKNTATNTAQNGGFMRAIPTVTQISSYLMAHSGVANPHALFLIWSGDNDVSFANQDTGTGPFPANPNAYVTQAATDLATAIKNLHVAGAATIIVAGLPYDFPTNDAAKRALRLLYTQTLWSTLTSQNVPFLPGDIDTVRVAIAANPAKYGFTSIGTTAGSEGCTEPAGITTAWALLCSSDPAAPSTLVSSTAPQTDLFADDQHLGTAGQKLMANYLHGLVVPPSVTHDFTGFGTSDIAWRQAGGATAAWLINGMKITQTGGLGNVPSNWSIVGQRDFNGDGRTDLLWRDPTSGAVAIWLLNGLAVAQSTGLGTVATNWTIAGTGDFNADGNGDLLWRDQTTGTVAIWFMNGTQVVQTGNLGAVPNNWVIAGTGDFDGDGNCDILWRDTATGNVVIWLLNGAKIAQVASLGAVASNWSVVGTGDFNADRKWDILWRDAATGTVAIWLMNGSQVAQTGSLGAISNNWSIAETGDFDGNGTSDLLWRDTTSGTVLIWFMNGLQVSLTASLGSVTTDWTIQGQNVD